MFKQSHMGEQQWFGKEGGGVACHFAVPASVSQSVFAPWESSEPCVRARVNTSTTAPISIALARRGGEVHPQQHLEELPRDAQLYQAHQPSSSSTEAAISAGVAERWGGGSFRQASKRCDATAGIHLHTGK